MVRAVVPLLRKIVTSLLSLPAISLIGSSLVGCAHSHFDGVRFEKNDVAYRIAKLDPAWQRVDVDGNDLTFYRKNAGTISAHATCQGYDDVPMAVLVQHLLFGTTKRRYVLEEDVTLDGRGAQHTIVDCELDGAPVRVDIYLFVRKGCVFDLSYVSAQSAPAHADFAQFARDFRVEKVRHE